MSQLRAIVYEPVIPREAKTCFMCFPPHKGTYRSQRTHSLYVCERVLARLVSEKKAVIA